MTRVKLGDFRDDVFQYFADLQTRMEEHERQFDALFHIMHELKTSLYNFSASMYPLNALVFFSALLSVSYLLSSTKRTASARFYLFTMCACQVMVEYSILNLSQSEHSSSSGGSTAGGSLLSHRIWLSRKLLILLMMLVISLCIATYKDFNRMNHQLLCSIQEEFAWLREELNAKREGEASDRQSASGSSAQSRSKSPSRHGRRNAASPSQPSSSWSGTQKKKFALEDIPNDKNNNIETAAEQSNRYVSDDDNDDEADSDFCIDECEVSDGEDYSDHCSGDDDDNTSSASSTTASLHTYPTRRRRTFHNPQVLLLSCHFYTFCCPFHAATICL